MKKVFFLIFLTLFLGCEQKKSKQQEIKSNSDSITNLRSKSLELKRDITSINFGNVPSHESLEFNKPTVLIVTMDSLEIEQAKKIDGEDNFYTGIDDLMWYNAIMLKKMDSLNIDIKYSEKDTLFITGPKWNETLIKDSTFTIYTYYYFDGQRLNKTDLFELLGD